MKTISKLMLVIVTFVTIGTLNASAIDYNEAMKTNIGKLYQNMSSRDSLVTMAATFQRIGQMYPKEWLPVYYSSYSYLAMTFGDKDAESINAALDKAQVLVDEALKIAPNESEIHVLQAFIYSMRITDASKGYKYSTLSNEALTKATAFNANNPRIYYMRGQNTLHTPAMFGGGKNKALPLFEKAKSLFDGQTITDPLMPNWGKAMNENMLEQCKKQD
jgi:hypothetical protein